MSDLLSDLVGDRDNFAETTWNRRPLVRRGVPRTVWDGLIAIGELDHLLASRRGDVHLLKDGMWVDRSRYMKQARPGPMLLRTEVVDSGNLFREFSDGATIVLIGAHEWWPPLDHLCTQLARSLTMPVQANLYVAPPGLAGHRHHDLHHIFALQLHGTKRWTVEGCPDGPDAPLHDRMPIDVELQPGDCLYVPRRFPHSVRTSEEYSTHVTFGVIAPTWAEVIGSCKRPAPDRPHRAATSARLRLPRSRAGDAGAGSGQRTRRHPRDDRSMDGGRARRRKSLSASGSCPTARGTATTNRSSVPLR